MDMLLLRLRHLFLWAMLFAGGVVSPLTFAYDGHRQATDAYDAPSPAAYQYDVAFAPPANENENRSIGTGGIVAKLGEFAAAKSEVTALTRFYPENAGFAGATERTFLMPGQTIDRYGGSGVSRFFSPQGTADWARSLPPGTTGQPLRTFEVVKPFEVQSGTVAPWFNQPGGGLQYRSPVQLEILLKRGIIKEVTP